jgi:hypothetical protein
MGEVNISVVLNRTNFLINLRRKNIPVQFKLLNLSIRMDNMVAAILKNKPICKKISFEVNFLNQGKESSETF